ncbi:uncharacterized protein J7T55_012432 [Diaporthe amygdali]|uniref:uncharacterized protein n=1 Tax=Phomopsis amygdali TaxID=1214568 RepID=UPI0022FE4C4F|nr:uncharacterized protein J7T55_012432 [Diaporthe amygdali]KAJ0123959.1 uncharacterized protein J7T55_012432 [Diaporthe amygdali]
MGKRIITVVGITGKQGASVADVFLQEAGWHVRGVTRNPDKLESQAWAAKGVELVKADLNDAASLKSALAGSTLIFGVTDFWGIVSDPEIQGRAQTSSLPANVLAYELEVQQGRNIVDAAFATLDTLDRFVLSTLSPTKKWSKGKYTHNFHFDAKWEAVEYLKATYPALEKKTSYLQQPDGTFLLSLPGNPDTPVAHVDARRDTGLFVRALTQVEPGKHLLGASGFMSWNDFAALWGRVHGVKCHFQRLDRKVLENAIPGGVGEELADMFEYIGDFGYHGGDPNIVFPADLGVEIPVTSIEDYIKKEDWSEVL